MKIPHATFRCQLELGFAFILKHSNNLSHEFPEFVYAHKKRLCKEVNHCFEYSNMPPYNLCFASHHLDIIEEKVKKKKKINKHVYK